jgi:glycine dehydrogenase subunit 2
MLTKLKGTLYPNIQKPLYVQLRDIFVDLIESEELLPGDLIPGERVLAKAYNVSRVTIRKCIDSLVKDGYLVRSQGKQNRVAKKRITHNLGCLLGIVEELYNTNGIVVTAESVHNEYVEALREAAGEDTAGLMLTNPNTLGLYDRGVKEIANIVHEAGGLLYYDGANMNAIMGHARPGDMGFDTVHYNLHKTFSTPHGGGGPGSGPVGCKEILAEFLPVPLVGKREDGTYFLDYDVPDSIGKVKDFYGHFGILVRAYTYILMMGNDGLKKASEMAVLSTNYIKEKLKDYYHLPIDTLAKHEVVFGGLKDKSTGVTTLDIAKRLLDYGYHPPTVYFPLIIDQALMIEPTETESKETIDGFIDAMIAIAEEAKSNPELLKTAPHNTIVRRPDETKAARNPVLKYEG